jgi:4'-phosphopantetheinyl transferase
VTTTSSTVQVWLARPAEVAVGHWRFLEALLDPAERERALRFRVAADCRSLVLAHALRRLVLGAWLGLPPAALKLSDPPGKKPALLQPSQPGLYFSHSRRRQLVAFAVTDHAPIGLDVEEIREELADFDLLARHLAVAELESGATLTGSDRTRAFFSSWTALEAFWKTEGSGLASGNPPLRLRTDAAGGELSLEPGGEPVARWWRIDVSPDHAIALALLDSQPAQSRADTAVSVRDGNQLIQARCMALRSYRGPVQADRGLGWSIETE